MTSPESGDKPLDATPQDGASNADAVSSEADVPGEADAASEANLAERTNEVTAATTSIFRNALNWMLLLVGIVTIVGIAVGYLVDGSHGVWGAVLGAILTIVFSGTTLLTMLKTTGSSPQTMAMVVLGGWIGKMIVLVAALAVLGNFDFYNKYVFAASLLIGVMGSVALDYRAVAKGRVPYVNPK